MVDEPHLPPASTRRTISIAQPTIQMLVRAERLLEHTRGGAQEFVLIEGEDENYRFEVLAQYQGQKLWTMKVTIQPALLGLAVLQMKDCDYQAIFDSRGIATFENVPSHYLLSDHVGYPHLLIEIMHAPG